ncbi:hypothetical protein CDD80_2425 [Ophiocordyceps camponoti-rufipedis]|uniref:Bacteriophage T5 Orf172 DNA-binding domain-containing protein n=1 Tax=Ophiocordyceps camponoti-rufipedis TaxID=2004952 RepID=A0A2C5ZLE4_9HYPO|nr:hypothetical protein CDD80_2425 [Ophiocordyceps camponoti-rufipedis]
MPFVANTPESLLGRSDSKDPGSTCRGITSTGRPCRRPVPRSGSSGPAPDLADESLYCWQHKTQASRFTPGPQTIPEHRSSLDTLADRLGLAEPAPQKTRPQSKPKPKPRPEPKRKSHSWLRLCCCIQLPIDEVQESAPAPRPRPRPRPRPLQQQTPSISVPQGQGSASSRLRHPIPTSLDAATVSALMTELSRPYADAEEAGYIYMFWLTPASRRDATPPVAAARSLLVPPSPARGPPGAAHNRRRPSDVVSRFAGQGDAGKMLLKIGRAVNVQRRMNQWQGQCGHDIEMLRYYPYLPGASDAPANDKGPMPRMTPHCRRVERLIHLELAGRGLRANLETCGCGRDHREWFQVEPTRESVRSVDDVIRRWVEWDETTG